MGVGYKNTTKEQIIDEYIVEIQSANVKPLPSRSKEGVVQDSSDSRHGHST